MSFHNAVVVYDHFAHLHRYEFGYVRDGEEKKLARTLDSRHSSVPAPTIKRATLKLPVHVNY